MFLFTILNSPDLRKLGCHSEFTVFARCSNLFPSIWDSTIGLGDSHLLEEMVTPANYFQAPK